MRDRRVPLPGLLYMCHLMLMSMDTSEQFKHSCIVQPGHCGSHCNKSKVTALGGGTGDCHCLNKLYETLRRYLGRAKRTRRHTSQDGFSLLEKCIFAHLGWKKKILSLTIASISSNISRCHSCAHQVHQCWCTVRPSKLTFTIYEEPLTPSLTERPLV